MGNNGNGGRTLSRKVVNESSVGSFGIEEVALPNGRVATLAILKHPGAHSHPLVERQRRRDAARNPQFNRRRVVGGLRP